MNVIWIFISAANLWFRYNWGKKNTKSDIAFLNFSWVTWRTWFLDTFAHSRPLALHIHFTHLIYSEAITPSILNPLPPKWYLNYSSFVWPDDVLSRKIENKTLRTYRSAMITKIRFNSICTTLGNAMGPFLSFSWCPNRTWR